MQAVPSPRMQGGETSGGLRGERDVPRLQLRALWWRCGEFGSSWWGVNADGYRQLILGACTLI